MENAYDENVLNSEIVTKLLRSNSPQNFQLTGTYVKERTHLETERDKNLWKPLNQLSSQPTVTRPKDTGKSDMEHRNNVTAKRQELYSQPKILLEKLCIDKNKTSRTAGSIAQCVSGIQNGEYSSRREESACDDGGIRAMKRKSPSSVTNKKKPYRSVARSEMNANAKTSWNSCDDIRPRPISSSQNNIERSQEEASLSLCSMNDEEKERQESALIQSRSDADQATSKTSGVRHPGSDLPTLNDDQVSAENHEFRAALNNFNNNEEDGELHDKPQHSGPKNIPMSNTPDCLSVVSNVPLSSDDGDSDKAKSEQNVNGNRSLNLKFSRVHDTPPQKYSDNLSCKSSALGETPVALATNEKRGHRTARFLPARSLSKLQRMQFARKFRKPGLKQLVVRIDSAERLKREEEEEEEDSSCATPRSNERNFDKKETDQNERCLPVKKFRLSPTFEQFTPTETVPTIDAQRTKDVGDGSESTPERSTFAETHSTNKQREMPKTFDEFLEMVDKPRPLSTGILWKVKHRDVSSKTDHVCRSIGDAISDWDARSADSKEDDKISSTVNSSIEPHSSSFTNKRENIFEKFRSPIETEEVATGIECPNPSKPKEAKVFEKQPLPTTTPARDKDPSLAVSIGPQDSKDTKDLLGDYDSDSTECCKYEDLDPFNSDSHTTNAGQIGGLVGRLENFYAGFSPFNLPSDSDDNLIVDESTSNPTLGSDEKDSTNKTDRDEHESDADNQLKKLRSTAYRNYTRMQRKGGNAEKSNDRIVSETVPNSLVETEASFKQPGNQVGRKRRSNLSKKSPIKPMRRKKTTIKKSSTTIPHGRAALVDMEESFGAQKVARLCKEFVMRSKTRTRKLENGKSVKFRPLKGSEKDKNRQPTPAGDTVPSATGNLESRPEVEERTSNTSTAKIRKRRYRGKNRTSNDTVKKQVRPGKYKTTVSKEVSESEVNQPPKIDILSRELGPRYNWLEQKIQAMQRSNSDETPDMAKIQVQRIIIGSEMRQSIRKYSSDEENRGSKTNCLIQSLDAHRNSSLSSFHEHSTSGDWLTQSPVEDTNISNHHDSHVTFLHNATSVVVDSRGSSALTSASSEIVKARPSSADSVPSTVEISHLGKIRGRVHTFDLPEAGIVSEFETRSESSCPSSSQPVKRAPGFRHMDASLVEGFVDVPPSYRAHSEPDLGRSLSLTNLTAESDVIPDLSPSPSTAPHEDEQCTAASPDPSLECPAPFDLRLRTVQYIASKDRNPQHRIEVSSSESSSTPMMPLRLTISPPTRSHSGEDPIPRRRSPDKDSVECQSQRVQIDLTNAVNSGNAIVIDLTAESESTPSLPSSQDRVVSTQLQEGDVFGIQSPSPDLRSIKHEYDRRFEMYERLSKVSKIKDQEIAILESERRRVKNELECLKNIFFKAASGHPQPTDFRLDLGYRIDGAKDIVDDVPVSGPLPGDAYDFRKVTEAHSRESTVSLLASQTPPDAHSVKIDLSMYTYLKCRYEQERSALDFSELTGNGTKVPGPFKDHTVAELSSQLSTSPTVKNSFRRPVMPVVQSDSSKIADQCGSNEPTCNHLTAGNNSWNGNGSGQTGTRFETPFLIGGDGGSLNQEFLLRKSLPISAEMSSGGRSVIQLFDDSNLIHSDSQILVCHLDEATAGKNSSILSNTLPIQTDRDIRSALNQRVTPEQDLSAKSKPIIQATGSNRHSISQFKQDSVSQNHPQVQQRSSFVDTSRERYDRNVQKNDFMPMNDPSKGLTGSSRPRAVSNERPNGTDSSLGHQTQYEAVDLSGGKGVIDRSVENEIQVVRTGDTLGRMTNEAIEISTDRRFVIDYANAAEVPLALNLKSASSASANRYATTQLQFEKELDVAKIPKQVEVCNSAKLNESRAKLVSSELNEILSNDVTELDIHTDETRKALTENRQGPSSIHQKSSHNFRDKGDGKRMDSGDGRYVADAGFPTESQRPHFDRLERTTISDHRPVSNPGPLPTNSGPVSSAEFRPHSHSIGQLITQIVPQKRRTPHDKPGELSGTASSPYSGVPVSTPADKYDVAGAVPQRWTKQRMEAFPSYQDNLQDMSFMVNSMTKGDFHRNNNSSRIVGQSVDLLPQAANEKEQLTGPTRPDILMTSSSDYNRNITPQRRLDRVDRRQGMPYAPAEPPTGLYRRGVDSGAGEYPNQMTGQDAAASLPLGRKKEFDSAMRLHGKGENFFMESSNGGAPPPPPSLQRYNELHQAMNQQARQRAQQHFSHPVPSGLSPRESAFAPLPPSSLRSEPVSSRVPTGEVSPNDLSFIGKPESLHFRRHVGPGAVLHPAAQIPVPRQGDEQSHLRIFGNVTLHADSHPGQQMNRKEAFPLPAYQKSDQPLVPQLRERVFHPNQSIPRLPYNREPEPPTDFNRNAYVMVPQPREVRRDNVAMVTRSAENLLISTQMRNDASVVNRILRHENQPRPKGDFYESNAVAVMHPTKEQHPGYAHLAPGNESSGALIWRVNKPETNPVVVRAQNSDCPPQDDEGNNRIMDYQRRHLDQRPLNRPMAMDLPHGTPVSGIRDPVRLHQPGPSMVGDRYMSNYIDSISAASQPMPFKTFSAIHSSPQVHLQRQPTKDDPSKAPHVLPRHPDQVRIQMPPPPPASSMYNDTVRLISYNHPFYPPPTGLLPPGFNPGYGNPGVLQAERLQLLPGFEPQCNVENFLPIPYTVGDRSQLGTNVRGGPLMGTSTSTASQPPAMASAPLRQRHLRPDELQPHVASKKTGHAKGQPSQDMHMTQQQGNPSGTSQMGTSQMGTGQMGKAGDYICDVCRKQAMFVCSACKGIAYCSTECQAISWQTKHSTVCRQPQ